MPEENDFFNATIHEVSHDTAIDPMVEDTTNGFNWLKKLGESDILAQGGILSDILSNVRKDGQAPSTDYGMKEDQEKEDQDSKNKIILIGGVMIGLLLITGIALFFLTRKK